MQEDVTVNVVSLTGPQTHSIPVAGRGVLPSVRGFFVKFFPCLCRGNGVVTLAGFRCSSE